MLDHVIIIKDDQAGHDRQNGQGEHSPPKVSIVEKSRQVY
jgi:hypothetical protein